LSTTQQQFSSFLAADIERTLPIVTAADMVEH
jgi:hypothetical protein